MDNSSNDLTALWQHAFHREKVLARRMQRRHGCTLEQALTQVLQSSAGERSLEVLLDERREDRSAQQFRRLKSRRDSMEKFQAIRKFHVDESLTWLGWFDGSAIPNPGCIGIGVVLRSPQGHWIDFSRPGGYGDSTVAEYLALILLLEQARLAKADSLVVHGDSQVVIGDILGTAPIARPDCIRHRLHARTLMDKLPIISVVWVPRAKNFRADLLARDAFVQNSIVNV